MAQNFRELLAKVARMDVVGVAAQQNAIARPQLRNQRADFGIGREDVGNRMRKELHVAAQLPQVVNAAQYLGAVDQTLLDLGFQRTMVNSREHLLSGQVRERCEPVQGQTVVEESDDIAENEY